MVKKKTNKELEQKIIELKKDLSNYKLMEKQFHRRMHTFNEGTRKLNFLYSIRDIHYESNKPIEKKIQEMADLIPTAWQYPKITCARLIINDQKYFTKNFKETTWKQSSDIMLNGKSIGTIDVCYLKEKNEIYEGPFMKEERYLIDILSERASRMIAGKMAQDWRRVTEEKYRLLVEGMNDGLGMIEENGLISYVNNRLCKILGYSKDEMIGQPADPFFSYTEKMSKRSTKQNYRVRSPYEIFLKTKGGKNVPAMMSVFPFFDADGNFAGSFEVITDISELRKTEESLKIREKELEDKTVRLEESNAALKVLLEQRDEDKKELQEKVLSNVKVLISPYIEKLEKCRLSERQMGLLSIIKSNLGDIVSPFLRQVSLNYSNLTPSEIQIANLIKEGRTNKEISELLISSIDTIKFHRKNIRKKLGLINQKSNLRSYLLNLN